MELRCTNQQKLVLTQAMQRSLEILQLPQLELGELIRDEIEKNPLLEIKSDSFSKLPAEYIFQDLPSLPSLHTHLLAQIGESFTNRIEIEIAKQLIELLDERGFITEAMTPDQEAILPILQTFDPPGIFARSCQETYLLQLERSGQKKSAAFRVVKEAFDDLIHGRYGKIEKNLEIASKELTEAMQKLMRLTTRPASQFETVPIQAIYPDLNIIKSDQTWTVEPMEEALPKFHVKTDYCNLTGISKEEKETLKGFTTSANWLILAIERRRQLLLSIGTHLVKIQTAYLNNNGPLEPICPAELAILFGVHESTISRALAEKYISTPLGLISLRSLISSHGNESAKQILQQFIAREDKQNPLTDDQLAKLLKKLGHNVARRTVAKYRIQFKIGSATTRKRLRH